MVASVARSVHTHRLADHQLHLSANAENAFTLQHGFWFQLNRKEKQQAKHPFGPNDPQTLNRYAYVGNNPVRYTDPSGHWKIPFSKSFLLAYAAEISGSVANMRFWANFPGLAAATIAGIAAATVSVTRACISPVGALTLGWGCVGAIAFTGAAAGASYYVAQQFFGGRSADLLERVEKYINSAVSADTAANGDDLSIVMQTELYCTSDIVCFFRLEGEQPLQIDYETYIALGKLLELTKERIANHLK